MLNLKSPVKFMMTAWTALAIAGCGSSSEPPRGEPSRSAVPGVPGQKAGAHRRVKPSPDEGSVVSAQRVEPGRNPIELGEESQEPATPAPSLTKEQMMGDLKNLRATEDSLRAFNLRIFVSYDQYKAPKSVDWDYDFMDLYTGSITEALPALQNFAKVGHQVLAKYNREFLVDGSPSASKRFNEKEVDLISAKIQLVEASIANLKGKAKASRR